VFTGIITDIGTIEALENRGDLRARIRSRYAPAGIDLGSNESRRCFYRAPQRIAGRSRRS
jgi:hypothetical protein